MNRLLTIVNSRALIRSAWPVLAFTFGLTSMQTPSAEQQTKAVLYKNPQCACCDAYADYLRRHDFEVDVMASPDLEAFKRGLGVPEALAGCHTMRIGDYIVEGHVPAEVIAKLLRERPDIRGISLPGMPLGSPGMTGKKQEPFVIYTLSDKSRVYAVH